LLFGLASLLLLQGGTTSRYFGAGPAPQHLVTLESMASKLTKTLVGDVSVSVAVLAGSEIEPLRRKYPRS
jgi:hypothetical protein